MAQYLKKAASRAADATHTSDRTDLAYEELSDQVATLKADLAELSSAIIRAGQHTLSEAAGSARANASAAGRKVAAQASDKAGRAAGHLEVALHEAEDFATRRPGIVLGVAAGVAALMALAMTRR